MIPPEIAPRPETKSLERVAAPTAKPLIAAPVLRIKPVEESEVVLEIVDDVNPSVRVEVAIFASDSLAIGGPLPAPGAVASGVSSARQIGRIT